jgi:phytoene synthase
MSANLPIPFCDDWPRATRADAQALWAYYRAGWQVLGGARVPTDVASDALAACERHELDAALLARQTEAFEQCARPIRFETAADLRGFTDATAGAHAKLLAGLAGLRRSDHERPVRELARALFYTSRLAVMADDVREGRIFIPVEDLAQQGLGASDVMSGAAGSQENRDALRKVLWKQGVRARDAFSHAHRLDAELSRGLRRAFRKAWFGSLEVLAIASKRGERLLEAPVSVSAYHRAQVMLLARFGRTTFR